MKLLTKEIIKRFERQRILPKAKDPEIIAKFFDPCGSWTWYATEFDGKDTFFGLVDGFEKELGYFSLSELQSIKGPLGIGIERDRYYEGHFLSEVQ